MNNSEEQVEKWRTVVRRLYDEKRIQLEEIKQRIAELESGSASVNNSDERAEKRWKAARFVFPILYVLVVSGLILLILSEGG